jgi:hypothetical protein
MFTRAMLLNEAGDASSGGGVSEESQADSIDESSDEGSEIEAQQAAQEAAQQRKMLKKLKLKFNGREIEEDLPFEVPEEHAEWLVKQRQMAMLSQHKAQELSQFEHQVEAFLQDLKTNPKKALQNPAIGIDVKQLAAEILQEEIENAQKSPEQIEKERLEMRLKELEEERQREKEEMARQELERLTEREFERYDNLMSSALEASDLPKSPYVVKKMTEYMIEAVENGLDVEPKDVIPLIREEMMSDVQELLRQLPPEMIEKLLGNDIITALRKNRVSAAKKPPVPVKSAIKDVGQRSEKKQTEAKPKTMKEFFGF